jgi:hypothetical protein
VAFASVCVIDGGVPAALIPTRGSKARARSRACIDVWRVHDGRCGRRRSATRRTCLASLLRS